MTPKPPAKMEIHSVMVRHPVWSRLPSSAQSVITTLLGECGGIEKLEAPQDENLFGVAIFTVRRKIQTIANQTGLSVSTVTRALAKLREVGWVYVVRTGRSNRFELTLPTPRRSTHGASSARSRASARPIRTRTDAQSDRAQVRDPHSKTTTSKRLRQASPPAPPVSPPQGESQGGGKTPPETTPDEKARTVADWKGVAERIGYKPALAERIGHVVWQARPAMRAHAMTRGDVVNVLEHVHERIRKSGTGSANPRAVRNPPALIRTLLTSGGCEPSNASIKRDRARARARAEAAYADPIGPRTGRLVDVCA